MIKLPNTRFVILEVNEMMMWGFVTCARIRELDADMTLFTPLQDPGNEADGGDEKTVVDLNEGIELIEGQEPYIEVTAEQNSSKSWDTSRARE